MSTPLNPRLLRHARAARVGVAAAVVVGSATAATTVVQAVALAEAVARLVLGTGVTQWGGPLVVLAVAVVARAVLGWAGPVVAVRGAAAVQAELRTAVFAAAVRRGPVWLESRPAGSLPALLTAGVQGLQEWFGRYLPALVLAVTLPVAVVGVLAVYDLQSAVIVLATLPLVPVFAVLIGWATRERAQAQWRATGDLAGHFLDAVAGLRTLRSYGRAERQVRVVAEVAEQHRRATMPVLRLAFLSSASLELVGTVSMGLVAVSAGLRLVGGSLGLSAALTVLLLAPEAYRPLREVGARFHASADASAVLAEVDEVLCDAAPIPVADGHAVRLRGVRVQVGDAVLVDGFDLDAAPGALTVLVGPSGAGKSTLLDVLVGYRAVDAGSVTRPVGPVAVLPQRPGFPGARTVSEALRLGWAAASTAELTAVLAEVGLAEEVGLEHPLGEGGDGLSAGQRQRLALGRTVLEVRAGARLVVADEPTAHLDPAAERRVVELLRALAHHPTRPCTVVAVAHRPALAEAADAVVRLDMPARGNTPAPVPARHTGPSRCSADRGPHRLQRYAPALPAIGLVLGVLSALSGIALTATASWLIVRADQRPPVLALGIAVVGTRFFAVARPALRWLERVASHSAALSSLATLRAGVYATLVPRVPGAAVPRSGTALTSVIDDVDAVSDRWVRGMQPLLVATAVGLLTATLTAMVLPSAGVVLALGLLVAAGLGPAITALGAVRAERATAAATSRFAEEVVEPLSSARNIGELAQAVRRVESAAQAVRRAELSRASATALGAGLGAGALAALPLALLVVAAPALLIGTLSPTMLAVLVLTPLALGEVVGELPMAIRVLSRAGVARQRLRDLAATTPPAGEPTQVASAPAWPFTVEARALHAGWGQHAALRGVDLHLPPGARVAVLGASGSGKSTLAVVLLRLLDPASGSVRLDQVDATHLAGEKVRRLIGWVSDDDHVFTGSLRANLRLAHPGADDAALVQALRRAGLPQWSAQLDVQLGAGAVVLSGGERRRLALARALLADPPVLVLDEPTEGLDPPLARRLMADLLTAAGQRTVLLLTHRQEGLDRMDYLLELVDGQMVRDVVPSAR